MKIKRVAELPEFLNLQSTLLGNDVGSTANEKHVTTEHTLQQNTRLLLETYLAKESLVSWIGTRTTAPNALFGGGFQEHFQASKTVLAGKKSKAILTLYSLSLMKMSNQ